MSGSKSKIYRNVNSEDKKEYWDYENHEIKWGDQNNYEVIRKIGRGKYSEVFEGVNILNNEKCVIKVLKPVKKKKIKREIKILQNLCGGPNIIKLLDVVRDEESKIPSLITEYIDNTEYKVLFPSFTTEDLQFYCYEVLKGLEFTHSMGVIHRDIKPHNIMFDYKKKILRIIDWGLAEFYHPGEQYNVRVASRYFKGPELLTDLRDYDYSLDLWSFGCMFAAIIFHKHPFFFGKDNYDQLVKICKVTGTKELFEYVEKYNLTLHHYYDGILSKNKYRKKDLNNFVKENCTLSTPLAIDFLTKILVIDHQKRLTAKEAMQHKFFDAYRNKILKSKLEKDKIDYQTFDSNKKV